MKLGFFAALGLFFAVAVQATETPRPHAYAFDQPEMLATQRVFGIGNAVTLLGEVCADDAAAAAGYAQWLVVNGETLKQITHRLADYYRLPNTPQDLQQRVAAAMHLKSQLSLSDDVKADACASLPDTLALPSMNLSKRYEAVLLEVKNPNYLKQKRATVPAEEKQPEPVVGIDEREEQTGSE
jgi:hypothetical protein